MEYLILWSVRRGRGRSLFGYDDMVLMVVHLEALLNLLITVLLRYRGLHWMHWFDHFLSEILSNSLH